VRIAVEFAATFVNNTSLIFPVPKLPTHKLKTNSEFKPKNI
jgi:hypothetical protein